MILFPIRKCDSPQRIQTKNNKNKKPTFAIIKKYSFFSNRPKCLPAIPSAISMTTTGIINVLERSGESAIKNDNAATIKSEFSKYYSFLRTERGSTSEAFFAG